MRHCVLSLSKRGDHPLSTDGSTTVKEPGPVQPIHTTLDGRGRYRVPDLYRSESLGNRIKQRLWGLEGIDRISLNTLTGTVLVNFGPSRTHEAIASLLEEIVLDFRSDEATSGRDLPEGKPPVVEMHRGGAQPSWTQGGPEARADSTSIHRSGIQRLRYLFSTGKSSSATPIWHTTDPEQALHFLETSGETGLKASSIPDRLKHSGLNILPETEERSRFSIFAEQFRSLPVALLGAAAGISVFTGGLADALVIIGVVLINAAIGFVTESEAEATINSLKRLVRPYATVIRDGKTRDIRAREVVPGDILVLRPGTYIAADGRLIEVVRLTVDESSLTGESLPVFKQTAPLPRSDLPVADRANMIYMGTIVTGGQGLGLVVATGKGTEIGRLKALVGEAEAPLTPMERQLNLIGRQLALASILVCGLVFVIGILRRNGLFQMLQTAISLAVAAVPEGLPAVATTTLSIGINKMRAHGVLIRRLEAVETLGAIQTICFDKTGTVTENRMRVQRIFVPLGLFHVVEGQLTAGDRVVFPSEYEELKRLLEVGVLCSETIIKRENGEYVLHGSATENALVTMAVNAGLDVLEIRRNHPLIKTNFRSEHRHTMGTLHNRSDEGQFIALKGNPDEILAMCDRKLQHGEEVPLTEEDRKRFEVENERMAGDALRVLGFAHTSKGGEESLHRRTGLTWLGLVGMADSVREGVKELIPRFHKAGIDTIMLTGDQSPTAYAVAKELDLGKGRPVEILDSTHLAEMNLDALRALAERVDVFARVSPANKLNIVQALQKAGRVVAMTGDGINDGPALKAADIGIALGSAGTDIAREIADVVLENDDLETVILAVGHGRTTYGNIRKSLHFLLSTNFSELLLMFVATAAGIGGPLTPIQLLWINLLSDIFPGLALAMEAPEPDILSRPPRDPKEPIIQGPDLKRMVSESAAIGSAALGAYIYGLTRYGRGPRATTITFQGLTLGQLLHSLSCRSEKHSIFESDGLPPNKYLNLALGGSIALQYLTNLLPPLRKLLGITRVSPLDFLLIGATAIVPLLLNELTKSTGKERV